MKPSILILSVLALTAVTADRAFGQFRGRGGMRHYSMPAFNDDRFEQPREQYQRPWQDGQNARPDLDRAMRRDPSAEQLPAQEPRDRELQNEHHVRPCPYHPIGHHVTTLPAGCRRLPGLRRHCYYWGGMYYEGSDDSGYDTVAAPIGATIDALPAGYVTITVGSTTYYYYQGTYYQRDASSNGYVVVAGPPGAVVPMIPAGYTTQWVGNRAYYTYGGVHYRPIWKNGKKAYSVVLP